MQPPMPGLMCTALIMLLTSSTATAQVVEFQTFDSASAATTAGWVGSGNDLNGNSFGFGNSNFTGGISASGEAGGTIVRTIDLAYFADLTLGATPTLGGQLNASGELAVTNFAFNNAIRIGFFNANATSGPIAFVGFQVAEPQLVPGQLRILPTVHLGDGTFIEGAAPLLISANTSYSWTSYWDPVQLKETVEFFSSGGSSLGTSFVSISSTEASQSGPFNAFGMFTGGIGGASPTNAADVFVDNLMYSITPVPEPASLGLCACVGAIAGWLRSRRLGKGADDSHP